MLQQATGESLEGLGQAVTAGKECKGGGVSQSPSSKLIDWTMGRGSWRIFSVREVSLGLLYFKYLIQISLTLLNSSQRA